MEKLLHRKTHIHFNERVKPSICIQSENTLTLLFLCMMLRMDAISYVTRPIWIYISIECEKCEEWDKYYHYEYMPIPGWTVWPSIHLKCSFHFAPAINSGSLIHKQCLIFDNFQLFAVIQLYTPVSRWIRNWHTYTHFEWQPQNGSCLYLVPYVYIVVFANKSIVSN